ncbi:hypothetical protein ACIPYQ_39865 [Streptomyces sp. NPDC090045]|uniref:hypothetical protein n=1 Tax=Streptomyces sp. NPDC090045 TaxID=3365927 RepID=UPI0037F44F9A
MAGPEIQDVLVPMAVPVITGLVAGAGLVIKDRRAAKSADHRYQHQLEKARLEVRFIHSWIQAKKEIGLTDDSRQNPSEWLDLCYESVRTFEAELPDRRRETSTVLRRLLLLRALPQRARTVRSLYWLAILVFNAALIYGVARSASTTGGQGDWAITGVSALSASLPLLLVILYLRSKALDLSESSRPMSPDPRVDLAAWAARTTPQRPDENDQHH